MFRAVQHSAPSVCFTLSAHWLWFQDAQKLITLQANRLAVEVCSVFFRGWVCFGGQVKSCQAAARADGSKAIAGMSRNVSLFFGCLNKWTQDELQVVLGVVSGQNGGVCKSTCFFFEVILLLFPVFLHYRLLENPKNIITLLIVVFERKDSFRN